MTLETSSPNAANSKPRILVVEDNREVNSWICDVLAEEYEVTTTYDGAEAILKLQSFRPDLIASDINMPVMSGDVLFQKLRADPALAEIPFIVMSANSDDALRIRLLKQGAEDYIVKPFGADELKARIRVVAGASLARRKLDDSSKVFKGVLDSAYDGVMIVDSAGKIKFANQRMENYFGYSANEFLGLPMENLVPAQYRADHRKHVDSYQSHPASRPMGGRLKLSAVRKNGSEFPVDISLAPFESSGEKFVAAFVRDITEERMASQRRRLLLQISALQSESLDPKVRMQSTADTLVPEIADGCIIFSVEDEALAEVALAGCEKLGEDAIRNRSWSLAHTMVFGLGRENVGTSATAKFDPDFIGIPMVARSSVVGVLCLLRDKSSPVFSEQDKAFAEILSARTGLALDNARLYKLAQDSIRLREEILRIVSHDLRNPLSSIVMGTALIKETVPVASPEVKKAFEVVERSAHQMNRLIDDLLDMARIESGNLDLQMGSHPANRFIEQGIAMVGHHTKKKGIRVDLQVEPGIADFDYDLDRVTQVFYNLLGNAVKFSAEKSAVEVKVFRRDGDLICEVRDHGQGIAEENLKHIFDKYWQEKGNKQLGLGLGLYISANIIKGHGGSISVESKKGSGTCVSFSLPMKGREYGTAG